MKNYMRFSSLILYLSIIIIKKLCRPSATFFGINDEKCNFTLTLELSNVCF